MTSLYEFRPERWPQFTLRGLFIFVACFSAAIALAAPEVLSLYHSHGPAEIDVTFNLLVRLGIKSPLILAAMFGGVGALYGRTWQTALIGFFLLLPFPLFCGAFSLYSIWLSSK